VGRAEKGGNEKTQRKKGYYCQKGGNLVAGKGGFGYLLLGLGKKGQKRNSRCRMKEGQRYEKMTKRRKRRRKQCSKTRPEREGKKESFHLRKKKREETIDALALAQQKEEGG